MHSYCFCCRQTPDKSRGPTITHIVQQHKVSNGTIIVHTLADKVIPTWQVVTWDNVSGLKEITTSSLGEPNNYARQLQRMAWRSSTV